MVYMGANDAPFYLKRRRLIVKRMIQKVCLHTGKIPCDKCTTEPAKQAREICPECEQYKDSDLP